MDSAQRSEYLDFFSRVAMVSQRRHSDPLWARYPEATTSTWDSMGLFLEGYAFERQGRPEDFPVVAADVIAELRSVTLDPTEVWMRFCSKLVGRGLNIMNNPLAPKGTTRVTKKGKTLMTSMYSAIEVANAVGSPLVKWVVLGLSENRADEVHARIREITGVDMKIASLFLRDVAYRYQTFPSTSRWLLQPIDTWVRRSAILLGATGDDAAVANFIVETAETGSHEPERVNQGMWYFGAEIAGSEYRLTQTLSDLNQAEAMLQRHLRSLSQAANAFSMATAVVRWAGRIMRRIDSGFSG